MEYLILHVLLILQSTTPAGGTGLIESSYKLLQDGGLLMGALMVLYGQHKFYRYMIDTLEQKHQAQVTYLEGEIQKMSDAARERSRQDTEMIRDLTRNKGGD